MNSSSLFEILAFILVMAIGSLGLIGVYHLVMGGLQRDRKQLVLGLVCLLGAIVTAFIYFLFVVLVVGKMC